MLRAAISIAFRLELLISICCIGYGILLSNNYNYSFKLFLLKVKGKCLCGAAQFTLEDSNRQFDACHYVMCRCWGGGPVLAVNVEKGIEFQKEDTVKVYDSSEWAGRGFCSQCGTHLFYRLRLQIL